MDFSEEWKSLWPIAAVYSAPLLLPSAAVTATAPTTERPQSSVSKRPRTEDDDTPNPTKETGPLVFTPSPDKSPSLLFSSHTLSPRLPPPYPNLTSTRFMSTSAQFLPPSTAVRIGKEFSSGGSITADHIDDSRNHMHAFNSLQLLPCSSVGPSSSVVAFFPAGENCDQLGYLMLRPKESELIVEVNSVNGNVFVAEERLYSRIRKLLVVSVADFDDSFSGTDLPSPTFPVIGYVMACSMYSVFWFAVKTVTHGDGFETNSIQVDCLGSRFFRSCAVVDSCWNPHLSEECLVQLETGELYLFDLNSCLKKSPGSKNYVQARRLQVSSNIDMKVERDRDLFWLGCAFSWHPRIFIIAHSNAVFLVDARFESYKVSCLLKIERLSEWQNDGIMALSRDSTDGFRFCVASKTLLYLCDVRQPCRPLIRWAHNIENPRYLTVFKLSELRSNAKDDKYEWASEAGSCVLLGSFWDCQFHLFVFGPNTNRNPIISEISKFCDSMYAWSMPSQLSLLNTSCYCGWCLVREEAFKDSLPDWIDWRQKKDIVSGFGILHGENFVSLSEPETNGGFLLIRLMSSGKLEAQSYHAAWEFPKNCENHSDEWNCQDNLLYEKHNDDYQGTNMIKHYLELPYLEAYLNSSLGDVIPKKISQIHDTDPDKYDEGKEGSQILHEKRELFKDINLPTSLQEIALRNVFAGSRSFFSCRPEFPGILKFLGTCDGNVQFLYRKPLSYPNKVSRKVPLDELGDSFVPPQLLLNLRSLSSGKERSATPDEELEHECSRVTEVANELTGSCMPADSQFQEDHVVSLSSDEADELKDCSENKRKLQQLIFHEPSFDGGIARSNTMPCGTTSETKGLTKFVFLKRQERECNGDAKMNGSELLDEGCPLELHFDSKVGNFEGEELMQFEFLKKKELKFQNGFRLYQEYLSKVKII